MGSSLTKPEPKSSKQQNSRTPPPVQKKTTTVRPVSPTSSSSSSSSESEEDVEINPSQSGSGRQPSKHNVATGTAYTSFPAVQNKPPSVHTKTNSRNTILSSDAMNRSIAPSRQHNNNDHNTKNSSPPPDRALTTGASFSSEVPRSHPTGTNSNASHEHHPSSKEKPSTTLLEQSGPCPHCPHCHRVIPVVKKFNGSQPSWIIEDPGTDAQHIILDDFDEEAVRNRVISEKGRVPGSYDYLPHLTMEETKSRKGLSNKYCTLPVVANAGPLMSSTRTPFPNYNTIHRQDHWLNKPYTLKLFTD